MTSRYRCPRSIEPTSFAPNVAHVLTSRAAHVTLLWQERIEIQLAAARRRPDSLIGARVRRDPAGSTARYVAWANGMTEAQLALHRFRECTLLMPTWFISRAAFDATGRFQEEKCEDLLFLQQHVACDPSAPLPLGPLGPLDPWPLLGPSATTWPPCSHTPSCSSG